MGERTTTPNSSTAHTPALEVYLGERTTTPNSYLGLKRGRGKSTWEKGRQLPTFSPVQVAELKSTWEKGRQLPTCAIPTIVPCEVYLGERTTTPNMRERLGWWEGSLLGRKDDNSQPRGDEHLGEVKSTWEKGRQLPTFEPYEATLREVYLGERTTTPNTTRRATATRAEVYLGERTTTPNVTRKVREAGGKSTWEKGRQLPTWAQVPVGVDEVYLGERTTTPNSGTGSTLTARSLLGRKDDNSQLRAGLAADARKSTWEKGRQLPTAPGGTAPMTEVYLGERTTTPNSIGTINVTSGSLLGRKDDNSQRRTGGGRRRRKSTWEKGRQLPT